MLAHRYLRETDGLDRAGASVVDETADPRDTRRRLTDVLAELPAARGARTNVML